MEKIKQQFDNIPSELKLLNRWVNWKLDEKKGKIPINSRTGYNASVSNPKTWVNFDMAVKQSSKYDGIGFVLGDGYIGVDIDNADNAVTEFKKGGTDNIIHEFIDQLESYAEYSQSGNGIHVILKGDKLPGKKSRKNDVEMYSNGRYFVMTGNLASEYTQIEESTEALNGLYHKYLEPKSQEPKPLYPQSSNCLVDIPKADIMQLIEKSKQGKKFNDLYCGNYQAHYGSQSEADLGMCNILAYWTGKDFDKIDDIFKDSGLYREKWDRKDYKEATINKAIAGTTKVYYKYEAPKGQEKSAVGVGKPLGTKGIDQYTCYSNYITNIDKMKANYELPNETNGNIRVNPGLLANHILNHIPSIRVMGKMYLYDNGVYIKQDYNGHNSIVKDHISTTSQTLSIVNNVAGMWAIDTNIQKEHDQLNCDNYILNLKNGLYNLRKKKLQAHSYKCYSTVQLKAEYNQEAQGEVFTKFINEVVPNEDTQKVVQEMMGYAISNFNNAKKAFILNGASNTGKSTFLNLITELVGVSNVSSVPFQELGGRFATAMLYNKVVNICADLSNLPLNDPSVFKQLTGGEDPINGEFKGQDGFTFINKAKLIFSTNELPENYGDRDEAFYNRLMLIPFEQEIPTNKQNPNLDKELSKELDYIFMWALQGLERLISNNMKFSKSAEIEQSLEDYKVSKADETLNLIYELMDTKALQDHNHYKYINNDDEIALHLPSMYGVINGHIRDWSKADIKTIYDSRNEFQKALRKEDYFIDYKPVKFAGKSKRCFVIKNLEKALKVV